MTPADLDATIRHQVHPGLTINATIRLDAELGVLFGASGAGKTSILRLIAGLTTPDSGVIQVGDTPFFDRTRRINRKLRDRRVGFISRDDSLFPHLNVERNIRYGLKGHPEAEVAARVQAVSELCGTTKLLDRRVATLSGGERQRVGLARAIAPRPRLLLCDEPVSALDLDARYRLLARLKQVQRAEAIPVLLVTHAVDEALTFGDRLFFLDHGQVVTGGIPGAVLAELASRHFLGASRLQNVHAATITSHDPPTQATTVQLAGGPALITATIGRPVGAALFIRVDSEEIVLARGLLGAISARNIIPGTIDQILRHDTAAEVAVRTDNLTWMVGIINATVRSLDLKVGDEVHLIIKARSCRPLIED